MHASPESPHLNVFFDGLCPLCSREIDYYRRQAGAAGIQWTDITRGDFDARREGLDPVAVHRLFHVKTPQGTIVSGVDAFIEIWKTIPSLQKWAKLSRTPGARAVMKLGYHAFVLIRPYLPRKKRSGEADCSTGTCER